MFYNSYFMRHFRSTCFILVLFIKYILLVYVNVNGIYYVHACEQVHRAPSVTNSVIENLCIIIILIKATIPV